MKTYVLIIDDDPVFSSIQKIMLYSTGLASSPHLFPNGQTALRFITQHSNEDTWFLLFLDLNMPVMNAWQLLDALSYHDQVRVVIVTSSVNQADREKAGTYPQVIAYLTKPIRKEELGALKVSRPVAELLEKGHS